MGVELSRGSVTVRPLGRRDRAAWHDLRHRNRDWLMPWEATRPGRLASEPLPFATQVRLERAAWRRDEAYYGTVVVDGQLAGRVSATGVTWGSHRYATMGYWIDRGLAGRGHVPTAVALLAEYCFDVKGLHRLDVAIRPENTTSLAVVRKLGFHEEGLRRDYLHVDGAWRDHFVFSRLVTDPRIGPFWGPPS